MVVYKCRRETLRQIKNLKEDKAMMNSVLNGAITAMPIFGGTQARPNCHPPVRMNGNSQNDSFMAKAIQEGLLNGTTDYETTESGIVVSRTKVDSFIIKPNFGIIMPEQTGGILLAR